MYGGFYTLIKTFRRRDILAQGSNKCGELVFHCIGLVSRKKKRYVSEDIYRTIMRACSLQKKKCDFVVLVYSVENQFSSKLLQRNC